MLLLLLTAGCFDGRSTPALPPSPAPPRSVYVAVGASESLGVGAGNPLTESWPQVLYRTAMPVGTVFYDLAVEGSTVADALGAQLPAATSLDPTVVTVWLGVDDLADLVPADRYERDLRTLVHGLRHGGTTTVLLANTPPLDRLPSVARLGLPTATVRDRVAQYNLAIQRVATAEGAALVDLHATGAQAEADGSFASLVSADGFHPSTAGHAAVARAFAAALGTPARGPTTTKP
jgi:lysophospholipase L1-like esterase